MCHRAKFAAAFTAAWIVGGLFTSSAALAVDVEVRVIALASPSATDTAASLPASIPSVLVGHDYTLEVWASDVGVTNTGLTSVYVDVIFPNTAASGIDPLSYGSDFTQFKSGTIDNAAGSIDELGASSVTAPGVEPNWTRVAIVTMHADTASAVVTYSLSQSSTGVAALGRGVIPWPDVTLGSVTVGHILGSVHNITQGIYYATIQTAINNANPNDEIVVAPGTYSELINFLGKAITVRSSGGAAVTTIDATLAADPGTGKPVVRCDNGETANTVLDGFTITGGTGDTSQLVSFVVGGGMFNNLTSPTVTNCMFNGNTANGGAGMWNFNSNPTVISCVFNENVATHSGGGMYNFATSSPLLSDCRFESNTGGLGGGMRNDGASPILMNCAFVANKSSNGTGGGGMYNAGSSCSPQLSNCIFAQNTAEYYGGGILNDFGCSPTLSTCTFNGNSGNVGGGIYNLLGGSPVNLLVSNCVLWGNSDAGGMNESAQIRDAGGMATVNFSDVQGLVPGGTFDSGANTNNINADPLFVDPDGADNIPGTDDDDLHLLAGSPCINTGDPAFVPQPGETDIDGDDRVLLGRVDIGADEAAAPLRVQNITHSIWYVTIQAAINAAVAGDVLEAIPSRYVENINFLGRNITLKSQDPADPAIVAATIIDGSQPTDPNVGSVVTFSGTEDATCLLTGLTVTGGLGTITAPYTRVGGGILGNGCQANIMNCRIVSNVMDAEVNHGGGLYDCDGEISGCTISDNEAGMFIYDPFGSGGGLAGCDGLITNCSIVGNRVGGDITGEGGGLANCQGMIVNCTISGNDGQGGGGGLSGCHGEIRNCVINGNYSENGGGLHNCDGTIVGCIISGNDGLDGPGGLAYCDGHILNCNVSRNSSIFSAGGMDNFNSNPTVVGCTFVGNTSDSNGGGGMRNLGGNPTVINCIFSGNTSDGGGGGMSNDGSSPTVTNCTFAGNKNYGGPGGGMLNENNSNPVITNSIFWGNTNSGGQMSESQQIFGGTVTVAYTCIQGLISGSIFDGGSNINNIGDDPLFVDADGLDNMIGTVDDDPRLQAGSLCIDAGTNSVVTEPTDPDGNPRIVNCTVDMGAYENQAAGVPPVHNLTQNTFFITIQAAIIAAVAGDIIEAAPCTYNELIDFLGKAITLRSTAPVDPVVVAATIIDGSGLNDSVVKCVSGEASTTVLDGLTITGGYADHGGGIRCENSGPTIRNCVISGNAAANGATGTPGSLDGQPGGNGGGIYCVSSGLTLTDCIIRDNTAGQGGDGYDIGSTIGSGGAGGSGGGIYFNGGGASLSLTNCTVRGNTAGHGGIGGIGNWSGVANGGNGGNGGGIQCVGNLDMSICTVEGNTAGNGGIGGFQGAGGTGGSGGGISTTLDMTITGCTISNNSAGSAGQGGIYGGGGVNAGNGGGLCCLGTVNVSNCTITGNVTTRGGDADYFAGAGGNGGGVYCGGGEITDSVVTSNGTGNGGDDLDCDGCKAGDGGKGGGAYATGDLIVRNCSVSGNTTGSGGYGSYADGGDGGSGAGVYCSGNLLAQNSIFTSNSAGSGGTGGIGIGGSGGYGAGLYSASGLTIAACIVCDNRAGNAGYGYFFSGLGGGGGGIYSDGVLSASFCSISGNQVGHGSDADEGGAGGHGGGVLCNDNPMISNCSIAGNSAGDGGNGWYSGGPGGIGGGVSCGANAVITNCVITGNRAGDGGSESGGGGGSGGGQGGNGGGVSCGLNATIANCTVSDNHAGYGGIGVTIPGADGSAGGISVGSGSSVANCILWNNVAGIDPQVGGAPSVAYSCVQDWAGSGGGNIADDPLFEGVPGGTWSADGAYDPTAFQTTFTDGGAAWAAGALAGKLVNPDTTQRLEFVIVANTANTITVLGDVSAIAQLGEQYQIFDYHIQSASPCVNGGDPNGDYTGQTDIDGEDRVQQYRVDIGADETPYFTSIPPQIVHIHQDNGAVRSNLANINPDGSASIQARNTGVVVCTIEFNEDVNIQASDVQVRDVDDTMDLTAPSFNYNSATNILQLTWPNFTFANQWIRIHVLDSVTSKTTSQMLDGEIFTITGDAGSGLALDGALPSGDGSSGGIAMFVLGTLTGDVTGDRQVRANDQAVVRNNLNSTLDIPSDINGDGQVRANDQAIQRNNLNTVLGALPQPMVAPSAPAPATPSETVRADFDGDGDVDPEDFLAFSNCYNGSNKPPSSSCGTPATDLDADGDIDPIDFLTFSNCFNGALNPPRCQ